MVSYLARSYKDTPHWDYTEGRYSMDKEQQARMQLADEIDQADGSPDELEELIAEMTAKDPNFPHMLEEAIEQCASAWEGEKRTCLLSLAYLCRAKTAFGRVIVHRLLSNTSRVGQDEQENAPSADLPAPLY